MSINQSLPGSDIDIFRKATVNTELDQVMTPASDRGFVVGVSSLGGHTRRIFHEHRATTHDFTENSIYIRDLSHAYKADLRGPFDFVLFEISPASLGKIADDAEMPGITSLSVETASKDIVLANLARALIPALEKPDEANALFVEQMTTAIGTYLVQRYGGRPMVGSDRSGSLSRAQEDLAKSLLLENLDGNVSISDVAQVCNLSRGYFIRAFRQTTGMTPYQWVLRERISRARDILRTSNTPLAEVAIACGFADQSHFTRVFAGIVGTTPGNWRRNA
ncbi:AraC family transcriptional regulator (plasmid) [Rhizobium leguminosarum]|uniref:AraC family transcriptional regulator n=1 Tax=Rhizobium TaxID=379 RepID=UPI0005A509E5|nr:MULTISPECIES: helix-turn-helix domain-containing protein [Rhizobium]MBY5377944.1 helix-turn-helix transcriptional regulator [Rhizobium leguminosarum]NEI93824.1 helix-turn-helix domain-containing protein [Rhizobium leguminosarum]NEJ80115.1 helix-turn-helix domain-containing protein [Rhizobium leguminosarum]NKL56430.1 AraC family transcriptional regulator [Rhizobium leguminosarum bv. viciae]TBF23355.1 AraC family transcriptional regulator [Rhizobium leguminosarum]